VALDLNKAIRSELRYTRMQKNGKYKQRCTFYFYKCIECPREIFYQRYELKKVSGRCRPCTNRKISKKMNLSNRLRSYEALYNKFYYDRMRSGQACDVSYADFLEFVEIKECHYCGDGITWTEFCVSNNGSRYNLDRKDNRLWYVKDNLVVCCWNCNETKSDKFTYEQFLEIGKLIRKWRNEE